MSSKAASRMSDEAIQAKTGKTWPEWFAALDEMGATSMSHRDIAAALQERFAIPGWWAQSVTVEYERERGMRNVHQTTRGYEVSVSKTIDAPIDVLFAAWYDPAKRTQWLPDEMEVRNTKDNGLIRFNYEGATANLVVGFNPKGDARTQMGIVHSKLTGHDEVEERRAYWKNAISRLEELVSG